MNEELQREFLKTRFHAVCYRGFHEKGTFSYLGAQG